MKFFLLDGSGFLYRAFYAFPPLTDRDGQPANVRYGFARIILSLLAEKPDFLCVARDAPAKTFRHDLDPNYKATRPKSPDEFKSQISPTKKMLADLGIPSCETPGREADDLIATAVEKFARPGLDFTIFSSDKDLKQLLRPGVTLRDPAKNTESTPETFLAEFGFEPALMTDFLAITGDSSDNIPGLPGFGPKKAADLIKKFGAVENLPTHRDELPRELRENRENSREILQKSKTLVQLAPVPDRSPTLESFHREFDFPKFQKILVDQNSFSSLLKPLTKLRDTLEKPVQNSLF